MMTVSLPFQSFCSIQSGGSKAAFEAGRKKDAGRLSSAKLIQPATRVSMEASN